MASKEDGQVRGHSKLEISIPTEQLELLQALIQEHFPQALLSEPKTIKELTPNESKFFEYGVRIPINLSEVESAINRLEVTSAKPRYKAEYKRLMISIIRDHWSSEGVLNPDLVYHALNSESFPEFRQRLLRYHLLDDHGMKVEARALSDLISVLPDVIKALVRPEQMVRTIDLRQYPDQWFWYNLEKVIQGLGYTSAEARKVYRNIKEKLHDLGQDNADLFSLDPRIIELAKHSEDVDEFNENAPRILEEMRLARRTNFTEKAFLILKAVVATIPE